MMSEEYIGNARLDAAHREVNTQPRSYLETPIYLREGLRRWNGGRRHLKHRYTSTDLGLNL